jgi:predicted histidine transporter YuiF (NhaC family)
MNAVVVAVTLMLVLSFCRINVIISLTISALIGGLIGGLSLTEVLQAFNGGLGGGAEIAFSYAMLGVFAVAIERSGLTHMLAKRLLSYLQSETISLTMMKTLMMGFILLCAVFSQNLIPVHIAFIPIVVPPLLVFMTQMRLDRRAVACVLTFGLTATYMLLPIGFGGVFLNTILAKNLATYGLVIDQSMIPKAMALPVFGMLLGLLTAVLISYRRPREYRSMPAAKLDSGQGQDNVVNYRSVGMALLAIVLALVVQLKTDSIALGALLGFVIFSLNGAVHWKATQDTFTQGLKMMSMIGFIMIAAAGFAAVIKATDAVPQVVASVTNIIGDSKGLAAFFMLLVGLLVTMGIGSSFSTVPILAAIYVPLCLQLGFSPLASIALIGSAAALGDAGSPASDSTLGPTAGLNADEQHDHIRDTVIPTFLHYNIPLFVMAWLAAMIL